MKWLTIQPLIGGIAIGAQNVLNTEPELILSYAGAAANDSHYLNYLAYDKERYILLDDTNNIPSNNKHIFKKYNNGIDFVVGCPVCAGLSLLNSCSTGKKARGACADQNQNMYNMAEFILDKVKPRVYLFENAPGLFTKAGEPVKLNLYKIAEKFGYSTILMKTSTILHGIPQNRTRSFFFFIRGVNTHMPNWIYKESTSIQDYLSKIPEWATQQNEFRRDINDEPSFHFAKYKFKNFRDEMVKTNTKTLNQLFLELGLMQEYRQFCIDNNFGESAIRVIDHIVNKVKNGKGYWDNSLHFIGYNKTNSIIGKNMWRLIHPIEDRLYSVRELLWFMGMPHDFQLLDVKNINHIAQNVPATTATDMVNLAMDIIYRNNNNFYTKHLQIDNVSQRVISNNN